MAQRRASRKGSDLQRAAGGYARLLADLKRRIRTAQTHAALSVNRELIGLYWEIGHALVQKQEQAGWGSKVIDRLATDLQREFPGIAGFSRANIYRMRGFSVAYRPAGLIVSQAARQPAGKRAALVPAVRETTGDGVSKAVAQSASSIVSQAARQLEAGAPPEPMASLPWFHNVVLIESVGDPSARLWYARQAIENGWSRSILEHWIDSDLHARQGKAVTNFKTTLPPPQSDLAQQILKDPYNFDFLTLHAEALERDLEEGLLEHVTRFLLELGEGFAFVGRQVHLEVDGEDFSIDLLFYHLVLRAFVVIDLKTRKFEPEFAGKMNFYLSAVDDQKRRPEDAPSIGLILCRKRSKIIAEYALRHLQRPVGVARYTTSLTAKLPKELAGSLPTVRQIERELSSRAGGLTAKKLSGKPKRKG